MSESKHCSACSTDWLFLEPTEGNCASFWIDHRLRTWMEVEALEWKDEGEAEPTPLTG